MRHILTSVVLVVLLFPALALGETMDDLMIKDGLYYKNYYKILIGVPFTGKVTGKEQGSFRNGKKEGLWVYYHDNGQLWKSGTFTDGKEDGPWVHYEEDGQLLMKGTYKDGKEDGPWFSYHDNGQLWWKRTYKDGERDGPYVFYHENGQLWKKETFKDGVKVK